jgi:hypothetical protein
MTGSTSPIAPAPGAIAGGVRTLVRLEGLAAGGAALALYADAEFS